MICKTCKQERPDDWDCGGDCVLCMADSGDTDCLERAYDIVKQELAALKAQAREPVAWMYQEYKRNFMAFDWFDEVHFVQPPNDPEVFRNITPLFAHPTTEPVKAQAFTHTDEPIVRIGDKLYVQNEGGYLMGEVVPTTERRVIPEDVRKVMEMALEALMLCQPRSIGPLSIQAYHDAFDALRNALNAAPAKDQP